MEAGRVLASGDNSPGGSPGKEMAEACCAKPNLKLAALRLFSLAAPPPPRICTTPMLSVGKLEGSRPSLRTPASVTSIARPVSWWGPRSMIGRFAVWPATVVRPKTGVPARAASIPPLVVGLFQPDSSVPGLRFKARPGFDTGVPLAVVEAGPLKQETLPRIQRPP